MKPANLFQPIGSGMRRRSLKKPIPARMVLWILSGTLLAFILFNMVSYYLLERVYSDRLASDNQIHTRNVALSVSSFYETVYSIVGEMAQAGEIRSMDPVRQQKYIQEIEEHLHSNLKLSIDYYPII